MSPSSDAYFTLSACKRCTLIRSETTFCMLCARRCWTGSHDFLAYERPPRGRTLSRSGSGTRRPTPRLLEIAQRFSLSSPRRIPPVNRAQYYGADISLRLRREASRHSGSNRGPADYKSAALPTELCRQNPLVFARTAIVPDSRATKLRASLTSGQDDSRLIGRAQARSFIGLELYPGNAIRVRRPQTSV